MAANQLGVLHCVLFLAFAALTASGHRWQQRPADCSEISTGCIACSYGYGRRLLQAQGDSTSLPSYSNSSMLDSRAPAKESAVVESAAVAPELPGATTTNTADTGAAVTSQQAVNDPSPLLLNSTDSTANESGPAFTANSSTETHPAGPLSTMAAVAAAGSRQSNYRQQEGSDSAGAQDSDGGSRQEPTQNPSNDLQPQSTRHGSSRGDRYSYGYRSGSSSRGEYWRHYGGGGGRDYGQHHDSSSGGWHSPGKGRSWPGGGSTGQQHGGWLSCTACQWPYQLLTAPTGVRYCGELLVC